MVGPQSYDTVSATEKVSILFGLGYSFPGTDCCEQIHFPSFPVAHSHWRYVLVISANDFCENKTIKKINAINKHDERNTL